MLSLAFQAALFGAAAAAAAAQSATVVIEASHGGAGQGLTNTTITVPLGTRYTDEALHTVSTLYLTGADGVPLDSITCTPYLNSNLTGSRGRPFTSTSPSLLDLNTVAVGSLLCNSTQSTSASTTASVTSSLSATISSNLSTTASISTTIGPNGTVVLVTITPTSSSVVRSTVTSTAVLTDNNGSPTATSTFIVDGATPTLSGTPSLNTDSAAASRTFGDWMVHGLAAAGLGFMAVL